MMDQLPTDLVLLIFYYLTSSELIRVEQVCRRWKRVIQEHIWNKMECITEEAIDYPYGSYLTNFLQLSSRLVQVRHFVNPFDLLRNRSSHEASDDRLGMAALELMKKLSHNSPFPLDLIRHIVTAELSQVKINSELRTGSVLRATVNSVVAQSRLNEFNSLRLGYLFVHSRNDDQFIVRWKGEKVPLLFDTTKIIRLIIGCLVIRLRWNGNVDREPLEQAIKWLQYLNMFNHIEVVEVERIHLLVHPHLAGGERSFELNLELHEIWRNFEIADFLLLLEVLGQIDWSNRDFRIAHYIEKWRKEGRLKRADLHVGSDFFLRMEELLTFDISNSEYFVGDAFSMIIAQVLHSSVDALHLTYDQDRKEENVLYTLKTQGIIARLKALSITLAYDVWSDDLVVLWKTPAAIKQVRSMVRTISDCLNSLRSLTLRFAAGSDKCPPAMLTCTSIAVQNGPLPHLMNLECVGLPCMPFIVSVVSQAPNLRRLSVGCQLFEYDTMGIEWINKLLDSVSACSRLVSLHISVDTEDKLSGVVGKRHQPNPSAKQQPSEQLCNAKVNELLVETEAKLQALRMRSNLTHLAVLIDNWQYSFIVNKELGWNNVDVD